MSYLLDTNVISELRRPTGRIDPRVAAWVASCPSYTLHLSVITALELELGIARLERRDAPQGSRLRAWLESQVLPSFEGRMLAVDLAVARRAARFHVPDPRPERDALIAATAAEHGMTVATRNVSDFATFDVPVVNPWTAPDG